MILMVVTVFSVFIRVLTRLFTVKRLTLSTFFTSDEIMILASMVSQSVELYHHHIEFDRLLRLRSQ